MQTILSVNGMVIEEDLTLEEAQEHCNDPETSSSSATSRASIVHTEMYGDWFDGYRKA